MTERAEKYKKVSIGLIITVSILGALLVAFIIMYSVSMSKQNQLKIDLENIYQRNFTELVDNVNNCDVKMSKVLASNYNSYAKKMLSEISKDTQQASTNLSCLPVSIHGIDETIKFINQVSGYTQSLANKIDKGEQISLQDIQTLNDIKDSLDQLKSNLNLISKDIYNGNIYNESAKIDGDYNMFTNRLQNVKSNDIDYPTMIYDGPFSDSTVNKQIKNLNFVAVSQDVAKSNLQNLLKDIAQEDYEYLGETNGKFETYDYRVVNTNDNVIYVQITKNGGKLLTMSCSFTSDEENYTIQQAIEIAQKFSEQVGLKNMQCVWSDVVSGDAYINLAPLQNDIILYPDLVKVKVDLASGQVVGFEACPYYINHTARNLQTATISKEQAQSKIPSGYKITNSRLCLAPLEYNREVLCHEFVCKHNNEDYYIYVNALTGDIENILMTIKTDNGNLLM